MDGNNRNTACRNFAGGHYTDRPTSSIQISCFFLAISRADFCFLETWSLGSVVSGRSGSDSLKSSFCLLARSCFSFRSWACFTFIWFLVLSFFERARASWAIWTTGSSSSLIISAYRIIIPQNWATDDNVAA